MVKCCFRVDGQGYSPTLGSQPDHGVRVNPKETPQPTTKTHLVWFGVFVGCGVSLGLTRTPWSGWDPMVGL